MRNISSDPEKHMQELYRGLIFSLVSRADYYYPIISKIKIAMDYEHFLWQTVYLTDSLYNERST